MEIAKEENDYQNLKDFFREANRAFMEKNYVLLDEDISERCLCGALMHEFNRSNKRIKQLPNDDGFVNNILPDIIVHSRGKETPDNLLVLEMKKSSANQQDKEKDRNRLRKMTKQNCDESHYSYKYKLGVYYEINHNETQIVVEFYQTGRRISTDSRVIEYKITEERGLEIILDKL